MDFYKGRRQLMGEIERIILRMKGKSVNIDSFSLEIARTYGFGDKIVLKVLKQYESAGKIKIIGDEFLIVDPLNKNIEEKVEEKVEKGGLND